MVKIRNLLKDKKGSAILESIISVGITITLLTGFFYSTDQLYTVEDDPGADLEAKSVGLMEKLIASPGQTTSNSPEWHTIDNPFPLEKLGLSTSRTIQYGIINYYEDPLNKGTFLSEITQKNTTGSEIGEVKTCFLAGTKIVMSDESYKNIEEIKIGDIVKSYDENNKVIVDKKVTEIFHHKPGEMGDYYLIINEQLRVTPNHRFYINGEWIFAYELKIGDKLFYPSTKYEVFSINKIYEKTYTYNFEVDGNHNYFVAMEKTNALVHNADMGGGGQQPQNPVAKFHTDAATYYVGQPVDFDASDSTSPVDIEEYRWDWLNDGDDDLTDDDPDATHKYTTKGFKNPKLTINDANNNEDDCFNDLGAIYIQKGPFDLEPYITITTEEFGSNPPNGYEPLTLTFRTQMTQPSWYESRYTCTWDFGDGSQQQIYSDVRNPWRTDCCHINYGFPWECANPPGITHTFNDGQPTYEVTLNIEGMYGYQEGTASILITSSLLPADYYEPKADYFWFDGDGLEEELTICLDAEPDYYPGGNPELLSYNWFRYGTNIGSGEKITTLLPDEKEYDITLTFTDGFGHTDSVTKKIKANEPEPIEPDEMPWILTGKDVTPKIGDSTFASYTPDYYVKFTPVMEAPDSWKLFEVKERASSDQYILDYEKIIRLKDGEYRDLYDEIKTDLGLDSDTTLYNFRIEIEIEGEPGSIEYGATLNNAIAKESTTREVLVYYSPVARQKIFAFGYEIGTNPYYKSAEVTLHLFIGGTPP